MKTLYYISDKTKAHYSYIEPKDKDYYIVFEVEVILPYLLTFPKLMRPQTIH
jgi:hypothetical protein